MNKLDDDLRTEIIKIVREEIKQSERRMAEAICHPAVWKVLESKFPCRPSDSQVEEMKT